MNKYTLLYDEEIHCNGVLMSPKEIILKLQKAEMLAEYSEFKTTGKLNIKNKVKNNG
tara:strand:- start:508 stop:678 length:171 start_codon:yes stop_codon:yes gene_type:complete